MITSRFSKNVPQSVAQNANNILNIRFNFLVNQVKECRELFTEILSKQQFVELKSRELNVLQKMLDGLPTDLCEIKRLINEIHSNYLTQPIAEAHPIDKDIKLLIKQKINCHLGFNKCTDSKPEATTEAKTKAQTKSKSKSKAELEAEAKAQAETEQEAAEASKEILLQLIISFEQKVADFDDNFYHPVIYAIQNYLESKLQKSDLGRTECGLLIASMITRLKKVDHTDEESVGECAIELVDQFDLAPGSAGSLIDLVAIANAGAERQILQNEAKAFYENLITQKDLTELNEVITKLSAKKRSELQGYECYFMTQFTLYRHNKEAFRVFKDFPGYQDLTIKIDKIKKEHQTALTEIEALCASPPLQYILKHPPQKKIAEIIVATLKLAIVQYKSESLTFLSESLSYANKLVLQLTKEPDLQKIDLIIDLLKRQSPNSGLKNNSFDTLFLSCLFNEKVPLGIFGGFRLYPETILAKTEFLVVQGEVSKYLRGKSRIENKNDRNVIRNAARHMLFTLKQELEICIDVANKYEQFKK